MWALRLEPRYPGKALNLWAIFLGLLNCSFIKNNILELYWNGQQWRNLGQVSMTASKSLSTWLPRATVCQVKVAMTFLCSPCRDVVLTAKVALGKCVHTIGSSSLFLKSVSGHKKCCLIRSRWVWDNQELWCRKNVSSFESSYLEIIGKHQ